MSDVQFSNQDSPVQNPDQNNINRLYRDSLQENKDILLAEYLFWIFIASLFLIKPIINIIFNITRFGNPEALLFAVVDTIPELLLSSGIMLLPFLFSRIFGLSPFQLIIRSISKDYSHVGELRAGDDIIINAPIMPRAQITASPESIKEAIEGKAILDTLRSYDPRDLMAFYAERSSAIANKIYNRAGVYLFVGVIVAFVGLAVFYFRTRYLPDIPADPKWSDYVAHAIVLLPGFGVLFFIEFVALFFLRQYRSAMDEFRYFDAVSRAREENFVILKMFVENRTTIVPTSDVIRSMNIYSSAGKIAAGETTDILEARKRQIDELEFLKKVVSLMVSGKGEVSASKKARR
jgi:hypothetical protein